jgi:ADYC domain-containing protein/pentapeptide repeat protein
MMRTLSTSLIASCLLIHAMPAAANHQFNGVNMNGVNMNGVNMNGVNMNGVNMNGVNMNGVTLGAVTANASLNGDLLSVDLVDVASTCSHSPGVAGGALPAWCSPCAQAVINSYPACGSSAWDASCVSAAQSVCRPSGTQLKGAVFSASLVDGTPVLLRLDAVEQVNLRIPAPTASVRASAAAASVIRFGSDLFYYSWSIRKVVRFPASRIILPSWAPACGTDNDGRANLSILAAGRWVAIEPDPNHPDQLRNDCKPGDNCGGYTPSAGFTISCRDTGAVAKCIDRMGYKPWRTATRCTPSGTCADVSLEPYLEACVRMVRADYCGDGMYHTRNRTDIDVMDNVGLQSRDASYDWMAEAQWLPTGAACMSQYRILDDAGVPYGNVISSGQCLHPPRTAEWTGPACALPLATQSQLPWPGQFGGLIGDRSSAAE